MRTRTIQVIVLLVAGLLLPIAAPASSVGHAPASRSIGIGDQPATAPVSLSIPAAGVDAEVERNEIIDGVLLDPSGPWVVSWYQETGMLGEVNNAVMAGHVDYWEVGPAVFWTVGDLSTGATMEVRGEDGTVYTFAVEWVRTYDVADLTPEVIRATIGPTDYPALTLITCGGAFDHDVGEYLSRTIVRGKLVKAEAGHVHEVTG